MNGPEGFLPKKLNFTVQVVQVLWYRPLLNVPVVNTCLSTLVQSVSSADDGVEGVVSVVLYAAVFSEQ